VKNPFLLNNFRAKHEKKSILITTNEIILCEA